MTKLKSVIQKIRNYDWKIGISAKLTVTYLMIIVIVAGISLGFVTVFMEDYTLNNIQRDLGEDAQTLAKG